MKHVKKSVLLWDSPAEMYRLVTDVPRYPDFLPWCDRADVLEHRDDGMTARIGYPNEHLGQSKIEAVTSPLFATGVGLVMKGFEHLDNVRARIPAEAAPARKSKVNTGSGIGSIFDKFIAKTSDLLSTDDDI